MVCIATAVIDGYLIPQTVKCEKREFVRTVTYVMKKMVKELSFWWKA